MQHAYLIETCCARDDTSIPSHLVHLVHLDDESIETHIQFGRSACPRAPGCVLGALLFVVCTAHVCRIITQCGLCVYQYADDTQVLSDQ